MRFALLIAAMTTASALLMNGASSVLLSSVRWEEVREYNDCYARATEEAARERASDTAIRVPTELEMGDCEDPRAGASRPVTAGVSAGLLLALLGAYVGLPWRRTRRRGYRPLTGMPELSAYLAGLLGESGVRARVGFLAEPLNPAVHALAFGPLGRRRVVLSGGLLTLYSLDRGAFRSIVLHELAHIRNRDLDIAFLTLILWRASVPTLVALTGVAAPAAVLVGTALAGSVLALAVQVPLLAVLVTLLKNAVLRSRELYADARVVEWEGSADGLRGLFGDPPAQQGAKGGRGLLSVHPPLARRARALADPGVLYEVGFWDMCAVGAAGAFLYDMVRLGPIGGGSQAGPMTELAATVLSGCLVVGAAGTVLWQAVAHAPGSLTPARVRQAGLGLGLGLGVFRLLSPSGAFSLVSVGGQGASLAFPYLALTSLCGWALVRWLVLVAGAWGPVLARNRRPRRVLWTVLALGTAGVLPMADFLLTLPAMTLYAAVFIAPSLPGAVVFVGSAGILAFARITSHVVPAMLTVAVVPLVGQYVSWRPGARHAFTGFGPPGPPPGFLVRFGVPAGLASAVWALLVVWIGVPAPELMAVGTLIAGQVAAALWAGGGHAPLPLARGAVAAFGAGLLGMLVWGVLVRLVGCLAPGPDPCVPLPGAAGLGLALMLAPAGTLTAWAIHALAVRA
ncbi:M48 family metalloprotease [Streptomyces sp. NBC_00094]|uniref:M48 family metalloprotease n=1 Tax=Streptomyces sp. NBC_00094 TaxID=2903620 RepID=UPI00224D150C|nr:M48 family metalloprotease [Streptomyces sp. NBC_00094]MCX5394653.1 M48 family metalloprotease [Streptomyces sp. NBC_00094]